MENFTATASRDLMGGQVEEGAQVLVTEVRTGWFVIDAGFGVRSSELTRAQVLTMVATA